MSWTVTPQLKTLAGTAGAIPQASILGLPIDGGFFGGYISHTANGVPTHALIVAPAATGATGSGYPVTTNLKYADETVPVPANNVFIEGAESLFDGKQNTDTLISLVATEVYSVGAFPAASFCAGLAIGGSNDWYLPARAELEIVYANLKPGTELNSTSHGINDFSVPKRTVNYTTTVPSQTAVSTFQSGSAQAFTTSTQHWSSSRTTVTNGWRLVYTTGGTGNNNRAGAVAVRAFRCVAL